MAYLRTTAIGIVYPYTLQQLRIAYPWVSFPESPRPEDLAPFDVFPVTLTPQPAALPGLERVEELDPELIGGEWTQRWQVVELTEEEQEEYLNSLPPEWIAFNNALPVEVDQLLTAARAASPRLELGLGVGLGKAADGDSRVFIAAWHTALQLDIVPSGLPAALQTLAQQFRLPAEFVAALDPRSS